MTTIIITAIIAFDCGLLFGCWWANREKDHEETDQEWLDVYEKASKERAQETARHLMGGI